MITIKIAQPNNDLTEFMINKRMYDDKTNELMTIENDISMANIDPGKVYEVLKKIMYKS